MKAEQTLTIKIPRGKTFNQALAVINHELQQADPVADFALKKRTITKKHLIFEYICTGHAAHC